MSFYVTGGTLRQDAASYVERRADQDLLRALREGEFCYVLTSRQMGKSSLMVRTATRLRAEGTSVVALDLTAIGGLSLTQDQWYYGLLDLLSEQLGMETELESFWRGNPDLGALQRLMKAIRHVVLPHLAERDAARRNPGLASPLPAPPDDAPARTDGAGRLVIFIDEIDVVRGLTFPTADFFAAIRECYNRRTQDPVYAQLTFCLLGVATPADLIQDPHTTPFNIGRRIELTDFTPEEALSLAHGLVRPEEDPRIPLALLQRAFYWAGGHPYLTQRLCRAIAETLREKTLSSPPRPRSLSVRSATRCVDELCRTLFFGPRALERDDNLVFVRERLVQRETDIASLLELYLKIRRGLHVPDDEMDPLVSSLHLAGIVRTSGGRLRERNRIYHRAFDPEWARAHMPAAELRRMREAFFRGVWRATAISAAVLTGMTLLVFVAVKQTAQANYSRARAARLSGRQGQRIESLAAIEKAVRFHPNKAALRNEAIASLALVDLAPVSDFWGGRTNPPLAVLTPDFKRYVERDTSGTLTFRNVQTHKSVFELPGPGAPAKQLFFSPDGRFLAVQHEGEEFRQTLVWDCAQREVRFRFPERILGRGLTFSPDGRRLAVTVDRAGLAQLDVYDLDGPGSEPLSSRPLATNLFLEPQALRFHPTNHDVLAECSPPDQEVRIWNLQDGSVITDFFPHTVRDLSWHPYAQWLAAACEDGNVYLLPYPFAPTPDKQRQQRRTLQGHVAAVIAVSFNHRGDLLASQGEDWSLRIWHPATHRVMSLQTSDARPDIQPDRLSFSADDQYLEAISADGTPVIWEMLGNVYWLLGGLSRLQGSFVTLDFSPDGQWLAAVLHESVTLWEAASGRRLGILDVAAKTAEAARFEPSGGSELSLLISTHRGLERRRLRLDHRGGIQGLAELAKPRRWPHEETGEVGFGVFDLASRRPTAAIVHQDRIRVLNLDHDQFSEQDGAMRSTNALSYRALALSPDAQWAAALPSTVNGIERGQEANALELWNLTSQSTLRLGEPIQSTPSFGFSPDGKWLVTRRRALDFHPVEAWDAPPARPIARESTPPESAPFAFSATGSLLAVAHSRFLVSLYHLDSSPSLRAQEIATLESPDRILLRLLVFSPDGRWLAAAGNGQLIQLWDLSEIRRGLASLGLAKDFPVLGAGALSASAQR